MFCAFMYKFCLCAILFFNIKVMNRSNEELVESKLTLRDMMCFSNCATEALTLARGQMAREHATVKKINQVLQELPVAQWREEFNALASGSF